MKRIVAFLVVFSLVGSAANAMAAEITQVKAGRLDVAAEQFAKAAKALKRTRAQLLAVPMPAADQAKLSKWLTEVKGQVTLLETAGAALARGDKVTAEQSVAKLTVNASKANTEVISFEFHYCSFQPSKYT